MSIGTTLMLKFNGAAVEQGMKRIKSSLSSLGGVAANMGKSLASPFAALTALLGAGALTAGLFSFVKGSSDAASSVESLTTQFTTLLGSAESAKDRMEEITKFAASTPFEIAELASTSKLLETMGGELISTGDGLRLVGDAAAMAGQPLEEVGLHIGRLFNAITSGTSAGESVNRLQELGLITGATKIRFEKLAEAQKKGTAATLTGAQALKELQTVMSKARGGMEALSETTEGKMSNMRDNINQVKVAFGTGINDGLRVALDAVNTNIPLMMEPFKILGSLLGKSIAEGVNGDTTRLVMIGTMIGDAIKGGIGIALANVWQDIGSIMNQRKNWFTGEVHPDDLKQQEKDKAYLRGSMMEELSESLKQQYQQVKDMPSGIAPPTEGGATEEDTPSLEWFYGKRTGPHPNMPGISFAPEGSSSTMVDEQGFRIMFTEVVKELKAVNQKLAPTP
jgi:Tape measure protein